MMNYRSSRSLGVALGSILALSSVPLAQTAQPATPPSDLSVLLAALQDKTTTTLQKSALENKRYSGMITVYDVEKAGTEAQPLVRIIARVTEDYSYSGMMQFDTTNLSMATPLKKGAKVKVTGRLQSIFVRSSGYINVGGTEWSTFVDVTIDEIVSR